MRRFRDLLNEVLVVYVIVLVIIVVAAIAAAAQPFIASLLYAIVAFVFIGAAQRAIDRDGGDFDAYGITRANPGRNLMWGLLATLITVPLFAVGYWVWEVPIKNRSFDFSMDHYLHWPVEYEGEPEAWGEGGEGVWVWTRNDRLSVGVRNQSRPNNRVVLKADTAFEPTKRGAIVLQPVGPPDSHGRAAMWEATLTHAASRGVVSIEGPRALNLRVEPVVDGNPTWPIYVGPAASAVESDELDVDRDLWWIALWVATQFLLIAFPEEYFYRGYVQTRLQQAFDARESAGKKPLPSWLGFTPAIVLTSFLFGLGHLLVPIGGVLLPTRMSVFFPSLIFGWLRARTGSIAASVFYHACCNLMVLFAAVHF